MSPSAGAKRQPRKRVPARQRADPGASLDVMRIEHENVFAQVLKNLRSIRALQDEVRQLHHRVTQLEKHLLDFRHRTKAS
jgi:hypothetical protein